MTNVTYCIVDDSLNYLSGTGNTDRAAVEANLVNYPFGRLAIYRWTEPCILVGD